MAPVTQVPVNTSYDERHAASLLQIALGDSAQHAVILGAGANTQMALSNLGKSRPQALRAVLDDNPQLNGALLSGLPVYLPSLYPLHKVDRIYITSQAHALELTKMARVLFRPDVSIRYTFSRHGSLSGRIDLLHEDVDAHWPEGTPVDTLWLASDRLTNKLRNRLRNQCPNWRYGPLRQVNEFESIGRQCAQLRGWTGARVFNFGCGVYHPVGLSLLALIAGAEFAAASDKCPIIDEARSALATLELIHEVIDQPTIVVDDPVTTRPKVVERVEELIDIHKLRAGNLVNAGHRNVLSYAVESIEDCTLAPSSIDIISSRSVFEHLADVDMALRALHRVLRPGGIAVLAIDFSDHRVYQDGDTYRHWSHLRDIEEPTYLETNRLRYPDYPERFENASFRIVRYTANGSAPVPAAEKASLAPHFRRMNDAELAITAATAVLRKD